MSTGRVLLIVLWLALSVGGCQHPPDGTERGQVPPADQQTQIPHPTLESVEPAVRRQLQERISAAQAAMADTSLAPEALAESLADLGRTFLAYDFLTAAEDCYSQAEELDPGNPDWPYYQGFLFQIQGRFEEAAAAFDRVLAADREDVAALLRAADVALTLQRTEIARQNFERALKLSSQSAKAHQGLGRIALTGNLQEEALEHFNTALTLQPEASVLHYPLGRAYAALGREQEARDHLRKRGNAEVSFADPRVAAIDEAVAGSSLRLTRGSMALAAGRPAVAMAEYRQALEAEPENTMARTEYGLMLAASGDLEEAEKQVRMALGLEPDSPLSLDALGQILAALDRDEEAIGHYRKAISLDPGYHAAGVHLAAGLLASGRASDAKTEYTRVLGLDPGSVDARLGRARAHLDLAELSEAMEDLSTVLAAQPDSAYANLYLAEALQRQGKDKEALSHYLLAIEYGLPTAHQAVAHLGAGNTLAAGGRWKEAVTQLESALSLDPTLQGARFNLAGILARRGRWQEAAAHYAELVEQDPDSQRARFYLGDAQLRLGRGEEAAVSFAEVVARDPRHESARLGEVTALVQGGRFDTARSRLEEGLATLPQSGMLAHGLARLLAACPQIDLRDGARALELALALQAALESLDHAETVAMAMAQSGRFREATDWQLAVLEQARAEASAETLARLRENLRLYESGEPCCAGVWWVVGF